MRVSRALFANFPPSTFCRARCPFQLVRCDFSLPFRAVHVPPRFHGKTVYDVVCWHACDSIMINRVCGRLASNFSTVFCPRTKKPFMSKNSSSLQSLCPKRFALIIMLACAYGAADNACVSYSSAPRPFFLACHSRGKDGRTDGHFESYSAPCG